VTERPSADIGPLFVHGPSARGQRTGAVRYHTTAPHLAGCGVHRRVRAEPTTAGPDGLALAWAVLWRGLAYGAVAGLLLSAIPILAVFAAAEGTDVFLPPHR
jgi:hypothetical protein